MGILPRSDIRTLLLALFLLAFAPAHAELARLEFQLMTNQVTAGSPLNLSVLAINLKEQIETNFNAEVQLRAESLESPNVVFSEFDFLTNRIELLNPGTVPIDISGWELQISGSTVLYPQDVLVHFDFPGGTVLPAGGHLLFVTEDFTNGTVALVKGKATNPQAIRGGQRFDLRDSRGEIVDQVFTGWPSSETEPGGWTGAPLERGVGNTWQWSRTGSQNHFALKDWSPALASLGFANSGLGLPWTNTVRNSAVLPSRIRFTNGIWSGSITLQEPRSSLVLRGYTDAGMLGGSLPIAVTRTVPVQAGVTNPQKALFLEMPQRTLVEASGFYALPIRVFVSAPVTNDVLVQLRAENPLRVPAEVLIPAGEISGSFRIHLGDDAVYRGTSGLSLTAESPGWNSAEIRLAMVDNDESSFRTLAPQEVPEGSNGEIELVFVTPRPYDLPIGLAGNSPSDLIAPDQVILPARETRVRFSVTARDNLSSDFPRAAGLYIAAADGPTDNISIAIPDDEVVIEQVKIPFVAPSQLAGRAFPLTVQLTSFHGFVQRTNTTGELRLIDPGQTLAFPPQTITFTNGVWSGEIVLNAPGANLQFEARWGELSVLSSAFEVFAGADVSLRALDIAWHQASRTFLVSEGPETNATGRLLSIAPSSGQIVRWLELPKPGIKLSLSDDGTTAWLASTKSTLQKVDLTTWVPAVEFPLNSTNSQVAAKHLVVLPGSNDRVVVASGVDGQNNSWRVALFQNGVRSTNDAVLAGSPYRLQLARGRDGGEVFAQSYNVLARYIVSSNSLVLATNVFNAESRPDPYNFEFAGGKLFYGFGAVYNPDRLELEGRPRNFDWGSAQVVPLPNISRAFYVWNASLFAVELATSNVVGSFSYEHLIKDWPSFAFKSWPDEGFVFTSASNILFLRTPLVSTNGADLSLVFLGPAAMTNDQPDLVARFQWQFVVKNDGPSFAPLTVLDLGQRGLTNLGTLRPGESRTVMIDIAKYEFGIERESVAVRSAAGDPRPENNDAVAYTEIGPRPGNGLKVLLLGLADLIAAPGQDLLYGALSTAQGAREAGIALIDPARGEVSEMLPLEGDPTKIAVSEDNRFLFARLGNNRLQHWDLSQKKTASPLVFADETILDLAPVPGSSGAVAIATSARVFIVDSSGTERAEQFLTTAGNRGLAFASGRLWLSEPGLLRSFEVLPDGLSVPAAPVPFSLNGELCEMASNGRYLYFRSGTFDTVNGLSSSAYGWMDAVFASPDSPHVYAIQWTTLYRMNAWIPLSAASTRLPFSAPAGDIVPWGGRGLAIRASQQQLYLLESPLVPAAENVDVGITVQRPETIYPYDPLAWTIILTNHSGQDALRVELTIDIPEVLREASIEGGEASIRFLTGRAFLDRLPAHSSAQYVLKAGRVTGDGTLTFSVSTATSDPNPANNTYRDMFDPEYPAAEVALLPMSGPAEVQVGEEFQITIVMTNSGPSDVRDYGITIPVDAAYELIAAQPGKVIPTTDTYWGIGLLPPLAAHSSTSVNATFRLKTAGLVQISALGGALASSDDGANNGASLLVFGAPGISNRLTHLPAGLLSWSEARQEILGVTTDGTVFGADPLSMRPKWLFQVGGYVRFLSTTASPSALWIGRGDGTALRFNPETQSVDASVSLLTEPGYFNSMAAIPGEPDIVLAVIDPGFLGNPKVQAFRNGVPLPGMIAGAGGDLFVAPNGRIFLLGRNLLRELQLSAQGITELRNYDHLATWSLLGIAGMEGSRLIFADGPIVDLDAGTVDKRFEPSTLIGFNHELREIYDQVVLNLGNTYDLLVRAWDADTLQPKWRYRIPKRFERTGFLSLGRNGVLLTGSESHLIQPSSFDQTANLAISASMTNLIAGTNIPVSLAIRVTNNSALAAPNTRLVLKLPAGVELLSPDAALRLGTLLGETNINVEVIAKAPGTHSVELSVQSDLPDPDRSNNDWERAVYVRPRPVLLVDQVRLREDHYAPLIFQLSEPAAYPLTVDYAAMPLTADETDLNSTAGTISFEPGARFGYVNLIRGDGSPENDESVKVQVSSKDVEIIRDWLEVTIVNDDFPSVSAAKVNFTERNSGMSNAIFTVSLSAPAAFPVDVEYEVLGLTAQPGIDFMPGAGTLRFAPGEQSKSVAVPVFGDTLFEPNELVQLQFRSASGALLQTLRADMIIMNDDAPPAAQLEITRGRESGVTLFFLKVPGVTHELQYRTNLTQGIWAKTNAFFMNVGDTVSVQIPPGFFRVLSRPQ